MIIDLRTIPHGSRRFTFSFEEDWWRSDDQEDQIVSMDAPLEVKTEIHRLSDKYVLDGELAGGVQVKCDRCLEPYHRDLKTTFQVYLTLPPPDTGDAEVELSEEDMAVDFIRGEEVELDEIIREQIYLSLPMKLVCSEGCRGLCPRCGVNLNHEECQCREAVGHPAFLKLKDLKVQKD